MNKSIYHVSPDGLLALTVTDASNGETHVSFHGFEWYAPASVLAELSGLAPAPAVAQFVQDVIHDRAIIAVLLVEGEIHDMWVTDSPQSDLQFKRSGEEIEFRYWSGKHA